MKKYLTWNHHGPAVALGLETPTRTELRRHKFVFEKQKTTPYLLHSLQFFIHFKRSLPETGLDVEALVAGGLKDDLLVKLEKLFVCLVVPEFEDGDGLLADGNARGGGGGGWPCVRLASTS